MAIGRSLIQRIRLWVALLPLLGSMKRLCQLKNRRLYIKLVILTILIGLADISSAKNADYKRQTSSALYRHNPSSGSKNFGTIKNPYDARDYMQGLAAKLSPEQRDLLLRGHDLKKDTSKGLKRTQPTARMKGKEPLFATGAAKAARSLTEDLEKYRAYAVKEGSRYPEESFEKMLEHAGLCIEDGMNVFTLGYGSDRGLRFRRNDGNDPSWHAETVAEQGEQAIINLADGIYSIADLVTLDYLDDLPKDVYKDNDPIIRPFIFIGRTIGSSWKTTENIGNTLTWGYFDNFSGSAAMCIGDIVESLKHGGQAVSNLPRELVYLIVGIDENTDKILDWVLVVPWELASNAIEMQGISNMQDYKAAFREKGVVGSILELTGSTFVTYRTIDETFDELNNDHKSKHAPGTASTATSSPSSTYGGSSDDGTFYFWINPW